MKHAFLFGLLTALFFMAAVGTAQTDPYGKIDTLNLVVKQLSETSWLVSTQIWNDEELSAFDISVKYTAGIARLVVDSASFDNTRVSYFAWKSHQVDTTGQTINFGGVAAMGPDKPPLGPGVGEISRFYISAVGDKKPGPFAVDTTIFKNKNKLMLISKDATSIVPTVKIITLKEGEKKK